MITKLIRAQIISWPDPVLRTVKVYPVIAADNAPRPFCVYSLASERDGDLEGEKFSRVDIEVFPLADTASPNYSSAVDIADAVAKCLASMSGTYGQLCVVRAKHLGTRDTLHRSTNQHGRRVELLFNFITE